MVFNSSFLSLFVLWDTVPRANFLLTPNPLVIDMHINQVPNVYHTDVSFVVLFVHSDPLHV